MKSPVLRSHTLAAIAIPFQMDASSSPPAENGDLVRTAQQGQVRQSVGAAIVVTTGMKPSSNTTYVSIKPTPPHIRLIL